MKENDISKCRKCEKIVPRNFVGYYPGGKNKKYVNSEGKLWTGRICPDCVKSKNKVSIKERRENAKSRNEPQN